MSTVGALLREGAAQLGETSTTPRLDAELLLSKESGFDRIRFVADPEAEVAPDVESRYRVLIERRRAHEPIAYLVGIKEFFGLEFEVSPAVLVPRPETELLVELALKTRPAGPVRFLDLGTGSGCVAAALARELRKQGRPVQGVAVDLSAAALEVAARNFARHDLGGVVELRCSDWFSQVKGGESFDIIVANPPYIAPGDPAVSPELQHEPHGALYAEDEGLGDLKKILGEGPRYLAEGGAILCEFGCRQSGALCAAFPNIEIFADLAGLDRVLRFRL